MNWNPAELSIKLWRHPFPFFPFFLSLFNSIQHTSRTLLYSGTSRTLTLQTSYYSGILFEPAVKVGPFTIISQWNWEWTLGKCSIPSILPHTYDHEEN
jgi:hypothetical protein